jgi:hypothetical protein
MDRPTSTPRAGAAAAAGLDLTCAGPVASFVNVSGRPWTLKKGAPGDPEGRLVALDSFPVAAEAGVSLALEAGGTTWLDLQDAGGDSACLIMVTHSSSGEEPGGSFRVTFGAVRGGQENLERILQPHGPLTWAIVGDPSETKQPGPPAAARPKRKRTALGDITPSTPPRAKPVRGDRAGRTQRYFGSPSPSANRPVPVGPPPRLEIMAQLSPQKKHARQKLEETRRALEKARKSEAGAGRPLEKEARLEAEAARWAAEAHWEKLRAQTAEVSHKLLKQKKARKRSLRRTAWTRSSLDQQREASEVSRNLGLMAEVFDHLTLVQKGTADIRVGLEHAAKDASSPLFSTMQDSLEDARLALASAREARAGIEALPAHAADGLEALDEDLAALAEGLETASRELEARLKRASGTT